MTVEEFIDRSPFDVYFIIMRMTQSGCLWEGKAEHWEGQCADMEVESYFLTWQSQFEEKIVEVYV